MLGGLRRVRSRYVEGTLRGAKNLLIAGGSSQGPAENPGYLIDFRSADHQWWQEAHHRAMAATEFQDQASLEAFALYLGCQAGEGRRVTLGIQCARRIDQFDTEHQATPTNITQLREVPLQDAQVLGQTLAHRRGMLADLVLCLLYTSDAADE